jgi:hypothetical protein
MKLFIRNTPNSVFFWNGIAILIFSILLAISEETRCVALLIIVIASAILLLGGLGEGPNHDPIGYNYWMYLSPLVWAFMALAFLLYSLTWTIHKIVKRFSKFNQWLNQQSDLDSCE